MVNKRELKNVMGELGEDALRVGYGKKYMRAQAGRLQADSGYIQKKR